MATTSSPLDHQAFSPSAVRHHPSGVQVLSSDHSALNAHNLPVNFFGCISSVQRKDGFVEDLHIGTARWFSDLLKRLWRTDISNKDHVEQYLRDQYRRNLRRNSIRNTLPAIISFIQVLMRNGKHHLEEIDRADLEAFIEHQ